MVAVDNDDAGDKRLIVAAAIISGETVLVGQRTEPPQMAGQWEFPGGQVEQGETPQEALARELCEELGVTARIGVRVGADVDTGTGILLQAYLATITAGTPQALEHSALRWVTGTELRALAGELVSGDQEWIEDIVAELNSRAERQAS